MHLEARVGSVGPMWPPEFDERNDRVKGFYPGVVHSYRELNPLLEEILELGEKHSAGRVTGRFIIRNGSGIDFGEAKIPLTGRWAGYRLLYFGRNSEERCNRYSLNDSSIKAEEEGIVKEVSDFRKIVTLDSSRQRIESHGMKFGILKKPSEEEIRALVDLYAITYETFTIPLDYDGIAGLISDPNNLVGVIRELSTGRIVSIGMAEQHLEDIADNGRKRKLKFAELSEAATHPNYVQRGLYTAIGMHLLDQLAKKRFDLVYGEARACDRAVNKSCANMGRTFYGKLVKHCKISGDRDVPEEGPYENLNVWAITSDGLGRLFDIE